jgi:hypothetical protein
MSGESHPEVLRSFEIIKANGIAQGFDLSREHLQPLWVFGHPPLSLIEEEDPDVAGAIQRCSRAFSFYSLASFSARWNYNSET